MTPEEIEVELKGLDVNLGAWGDAEGTDVKLNAVERQKAALLHLRSALEGMVEKDRQATMLLREQLTRLEHGGGS